MSMLLSAAGQLSRSLSRLSAKIGQEGQEIFAVQSKACFSHSGPSARICGRAVKYHSLIGGSFSYLGALEDC